MGVGLNGRRSRYAISFLEFYLIVWNSPSETLFSRDSDGLRQLLAMLLSNLQVIQGEESRHLLSDFTRQGQRALIILSCRCSGPLTSQTAFMCMYLTLY